ncbi:hypothetical protein H5410_025969 [Solanum commersonii]|uniref:Uncharacterized protein n=1 Tax=Solanum commersonii TaxID=4109 RepID=A0A9J5YXD1_SOLCO|nr:hypothetical protein H5410_025969 [Solanum commersonii]
MKETKPIFLTPKISPIIFPTIKSVTAFKAIGFSNDSTVPKFKIAYSYVAIIILIGNLQRINIDSKAYSNNLFLCCYNHSHRKPSEDKYRGKNALFGFDYMDFVVAFSLDKN